MVNPVSSGHHNHASQVSQPTPQPRPQPKPKTTEVKDTVKLSRTADVDHDGDSR
jgi:hypothetical protein